MTRRPTRPCWCGNAGLIDFGARYGRCDACGTLVSLDPVSDEALLVADDDSDFYGKQYWLDHQSQELGSPDIHARARSDLTERNLHWLRALLKYCPPPARVLEVGCAHGSFVALMNRAGYDAAGLELSPWVVGFARDTFGVPVHLGPVETLDLAEGSLDAVVLMDVLEHLPRPAETLRRCLELLKPDGVIVVQTPCFPEATGYDALLETGDRFTEMLLPDEHLYLFSRRSVADFFQRLGAPVLHFEPALYDAYDMFFVVGRMPLETSPPADQEAALALRPEGRFVQALLDLRRRELDLISQLRESEADRAARWEQIQVLTTQLQAGEAQPALRRELEQSEQDRAARLEQIHALTAQLPESQAERSQRLHDSQQLAQRLRDSEAELAQTRERLYALQAGLRQWLQRPPARLLRACGGLTNVVEDFAHATPAGPSALRVVAVDMTPVVAGGVNGGAKVFVIELLRRLAALAPHTDFVLLTQAGSHEELAFLDRPNLRRRLVVAGGDAPDVASRAKNLAKRWLPHLPSLPRRVLGKVAVRAQGLLRRPQGGLLRELQADLLFCPFTAPTFYEHGVPAVCTIYDLQYKTFPDFFPAEEVMQRDRTFRDACHKATALTAISDYSRASAIRHGALDDARIRTIHLRMAQRVAGGAPADGVLGRFGLAAGRYLLYPANFWRHKNHEMLLAAFGMACRDGLAGDVKLVCTGAPGERHAWLAQAAGGMGLGGRVLFPGYLDEAELVALLTHSGGLIFPSLYEGFGLPVIEAMAAGVPVACSNVTSLPEVADRAALLFDPRIPEQIAAAMLALVGDGPLRERLIAAGRVRALEFADADRMAREYWDLFEFARANACHENSLTGVFADGWASDRLDVQIAPAAGPQALELEFLAPEWLPQARVTLRARQGGKKQGAPVEVVRGRSTSLRLPVEGAGGHYELRLSPAFVPARSGQGADTRALTVMLKSCRVVNSDGTRVELFPESAAA